MSAIPLKVIEDLYFKALTNPDTWKSGGRAYEMMVTRKGDIYLEHYGTRIFHYDPKTKKTDYGGAYSISDRDAINSIVRVSRKGIGVYYRGGRLYQDGTGPAYEPKKTTRRV